jgi:hypothetical protein
MEQFGEGPMERPHPERKHRKLSPWEHAKKEMRSLAAIAIFSTGCTLMNPHVEQETRHETKVAHMIEEYVEFAHDTERLSEDEKTLLRAQLRFITEQFPWYAIKSLRTAAEEAWEAPVDHRPDVEGFEFLGLKNEALAELWSEGNYPAGTINSNLMRIDYIDVPSVKRSSYNLSDSTLTTVAANFITGDSTRFFGHPSLTRKEERALLPKKWIRCLRMSSRMPTHRTNQIFCFRPSGLRCSLI